MEFYNCVIFIRERNEDISTHREFQDTEYHFYSIGNVGDSKKTDDTRVNDKNDPLECIVEITDYNVPLAEFPTGMDGICPESEWKDGNTAYDNLYSEYEYEDGEFKSFGSGSYEFRYEMKKITEEQRQTNIDNWREFYKFVVTSSDEEFYARLKEWFVVDSALYYRLFVESRTMVDNLAKNSFWHYGKVYISDEEAKALGEDAGGYIIDNEQAAIRNGYRYDIAFGYDFDTAFGIGNTGKLNIPYGKEDTDFYVDGDSTSGYIYRAAESTFFCRVRDLFKSESQVMYVELENKGLWSSTRTIKQWDDAQNQFPEELWRLHFQRVYERTYRGISVDNSIAGVANPRFLEEMWNGKKKYQRRMFMRNQELYFATKYFGKVATQDQIMMRFNNPVGATITPDFTLYITPFSDMYIGTSFGNVTPTNFRAKAGVEYTIPCSIESGTADITLIYGASFIQAIGDLSRCYVGDNDFSKASRLQSLIVGSDKEGYENTFMTKINVGNNKLLEYLDIRKVTGLNSVVDLSACGNLIELHAEDSGATGVIFANGGKVERAYIPAVTSMTVKNLNYLKEFVVASYDNMQTLVVENTPFLNTYEIVNASPILRTIRLIGIDWNGSYNVPDTTILDRISTMRGIDNTGGEISLSVLAGLIYVPVIKEHDYYLYKETWNDLTIEYGSMTPQFAVTFVNDDGTVIEVQHVDMYSDAVDPTTRAENPIIPTKESTVSTDYTFSHWDTTFINIQSNKTVKAVYTEKTREYTVKYVQTVNNTTVPLQTKTVPYGSYSYYEGTTPSYIGQEQSGTYYLFNRWDKSGYVDGDKTITAVFDKCTYVGGYFEDKELTDLSPVEIYALTRLVEDGRIGIVDGVDGFKYIDGTNISEGDYYSFRMGSDFDFDDLADKTFTIIDINEPKTFSGATGDYYDTGINILEIDRDFVLAVDYEFAEESTSGNILMECFYDGRGFKLLYNENPLISWSGSKETVCGSGTNREMLVLRHIAGETGLHVYTSSISNMSVGYIELESLLTSTNNLSLIFGCGRRNASVLTAYASGTIHWAKVWYADLGDNACRKLASYIHEEVNLRVAGFQRYFLEDINKLTTIDFIGSKALYTKKRLHTGSNIGGWASTELNTWLNSRFYDGMPIQVQQLLKKVRVKSRSGGMSDEITYGLSYVYIPAMTELFNDTTYSSSPYLEESDAERPVCISHMTDNTARSLLDANGMATEYWTRSPSDAGSSSGGKSYFHYVNKNGGAESVGTSSHMHGIVVEFSI